MKKINKKVISLLLAIVTAIALIGCSSGSTDNTAQTDTASENTAETASGETAAESTENAEETTEALPASIDFEDGNFSFAAVKTSMPSADKSELSVVDFDGSKALLAKNVEGSNMFIAFNMGALLGDSVKDVKTLNFDIGTAHSDGIFYATSGTVYVYAGEDNAENKPVNWSVYIDMANPKTVSVDVSEFEFVPGADNYFVISKETDNGDTAGDLYFDNITFIDGSGNVLTADSSVEFGKPAGFGGSGGDTANLFGLTHKVSFDGFAVSGDGWSQAGFAMPQNVIDALVPGSVVEISYSSETGNIWVVMNEAEAGWMRVGVGDADGSGQEYAYVNSAHNVAQITYEQIAKLCGNDVSTWGSTMQCESDGAWEVYSVTVGLASKNYTITDAVDFEGFAVSGDGWSQAGVAMPQNIIDALVPGSVVEVSYSSETGNIWLVMNEAEAGWMRVGVGDADGSGQGYIISDGNKAYIPFELIAEYCSDDVSTWGTTMQCESDGAWEVYSVRVGTGAELIPVNSFVKVDDFAVSGDAWSQDGKELTDEQLEALVPGSVIEVTYSSETGEIWLVFPDAEAGWTRIGVGNYDGSGSTEAYCTGSTAQIPFEMVSDVLGSDVSKWGKRIQCEASSPWEVTSLAIGTQK